MAPFLTLVNCVDPKRTEQFLLTQDHVLDASVWFDCGELSAYVTVTPHSEMSTDWLRQCCVAGVGENHTPQKMTLVCARTRAA